MYHSVTALAFILFRATAATPITVNAQLSPINETHIALKVANDHGHDLSLLKWNSFLDTNTEYNSFTVKTKDSNQILVPGPEMVRKIYEERALDGTHIKTLSAGGFHEAVFDMTRLFQVPTDGEYTIVLNAKIKHLPSSNTLENNTNIDIISNTLTTKLVKSQKPPQKMRKRTAFTFDPSCDAAQQSVISQAVAVAIKMAWEAQKAVPKPGATSDLYTKYFNDSSNTKVHSVFSNIASYDISTFASMPYYCNRDEDLPPPGDCASGPSAYAPSDPNQSYITLCDAFFRYTWSSALCSFPGDTSNTLQGEAFATQPHDQPSIILHEMFHNKPLVGITGIDDGPGNNTYVYNDVIALATDAASNGDLPLSCASSFQYFAMAVANETFPAAPCVGCGFKPAAGDCPEGSTSVACVAACP